MNNAESRAKALRHTPFVTTHPITNTYRYDVVNFLSKSENVGVELGVASGEFSKRLLDSGKFKILFGIDQYGDIHDTNEYKETLKNIGIESHHKIFRLSFDEALDIFPDEYFDFIYVDGFAHTGEEGGKTLIDWYQKLKVGGIMSGDDYHTDWPLVIWAVNHFAKQVGTEINLTSNVLNDRYSKYPTWFFQKKSSASPGSLTLDPVLVDIANKERLRIHNLRMNPPRPSLSYRLLRYIWRKLKGVLTKNKE